MSTENIESQLIRETAESIPLDFTVKLPALSPDKWFDGTVENTKMWDMNFIDVPLSELLSYIADMAE